MEYSFHRKSVKLTDIFSQFNQLSTISSEENIVGIPLAGILIRAPARGGPTKIVTDSGSYQNCPPPAYRSRKSSPGPTVIGASSSGGPLLEFFRPRNRASVLSGFSRLQFPCAVHG